MKDDNLLLKRVQYFQENYDMIVHEIPAAEKKQYITDPEIEGHRICRFCGQDVKKIRSKDDAHAISEMLGNKSIFLANECYDCNHFFGEVLEDSFAKYLGITRTLSQTRGKKGCPSFLSHDGKFRMDITEQGTVIQTTSDSSIPDLQDTYIDFYAERDRYIPIDSYRLLVVIALSVIPHPEFIRFLTVAVWCRADRKKEEGKKILDEWQEFSSQYASKIFETFVPGPKPLPLQIWVFRRKSDAKDTVPYCQAVLEFDNLRYQFCIPSEQDSIYGAETSFSILSFPGEEEALTEYEEFIARYGTPETHVINLSNHDPVSGEKIVRRISFLKKAEQDKKEVEEFLNEHHIKKLKPK